MRTLYFLGWLLAVLIGSVTLLGVSLSLSKVHPPEPEFMVWVENPMIRVKPETPPARKNTVEIAAARNETEPFQVIISALAHKLEDITATVSDLEDGQGNKIDHSQMTLYRQQYIYVRDPSPYSTEPPGWWPDALIPFLNPADGRPVRPMQVTREELGGKITHKLSGARFTASPFDVWPGKNQPLWIDVSIPKDAVPGYYTGKFTVKISNHEDVHLPVKVTVWNFTLPDGPPLATHFGSLDQIAAKHGVAPGSPDFTVIYDRYAKAMADHRLSPPIPDSLHPPLKPDGSIDWKKTHEGLRHYMVTYNVRSFQIPTYPFADPLKSNRKYVIRYLQSYYEYLKVQGWEKGAYYYPVEEPNSREAYDQVRAYAQLVHEANLQLKLLCTEQPYTQDPAWGDLRESVDIWCPLFAFFEEESAKAAQQRGNEIWAYTALCQKSPLYHPQFAKVSGLPTFFWQIDFPLLNYRLPLWTMRRYDIVGLLYWSTVYWSSPERDVWTDPAFRNRYNGDGLLFYPGTEAGIQGPVTSIRLKALREGLEDYAYFALLEKLGDQTYLNQEVSKMAASWWKWDDNPEHLYQVRAALAKRILEKQGSNRGEMRITR
ncbi:MAG: hypothetical protein DMG05_14645 [Acidobacteria bacterium]|nr:MAG: hypothetical protein DMG05_14645 [Acidobacteriota bacterium]